MGRFGFATTDIERMLDDNQSIKGFSLLPPEGVSSDLATAGTLRVVEGDGFPLHQASEAHRAIEERRVAGKVVLVP